MIQKEDIASLMDAVSEVVKRYVATAIAPLSKQVAAVEARTPERGEKGERGEAGSAGETGAKGDAGERGEQGLQGERGEKGEPGEKGERGPAGQTGDAGPRGEDGKSVSVDDVLPALKEELQMAVKALPVPKDGKDGRDGVDGKSVSMEDVLPELRVWFAKFMDSVPIPKDGRDGKDGINGTSVSVDDVRSVVNGIVQSEQAKWALDFERRAQDQLQRAFDKMPIPKDGANGRDGFGFDDLDVLHDGERGFTLRFTQGERVKEFHFTIPLVLERGIYRAGTQYQKGDGVTFGGSYWIALKDTTEKPGEGNADWRLSVKKGRDGRDGLKGERGEPGRSARDVLTRA